MKALLEEYLYLNKYYSISRENLKLQLVSHPDYPSIKAVTDTLDYFKINNIAASIPKANIDDLPPSFLALMDENEGNNLVLARKKGEYLELHFDGGIKKEYLVDQFADKWSGTIVAVEESLDRKRKADHSVSGIQVFGVILLFAMVISYSFNPIAFTLSILSLAGVFLSYLIVKEELGVHSRFTSKVCGSVSSTGSCSDVINSANSKLFSVSLSDLSVTFFVGFALIYSLLGFNYTFAITLLSLSLPLILFSIYQQGFVIKKWCVLCLGVMGLILAQWALVFLNPEAISFSWNYILSSGFIMASVYVGWYYAKPVIASHLEHQKTKLEYLRFKRNQNMFQSMLKQKPLLYPEVIESENKVSFGSGNPLIVIDAVTNPMCGFCADAFKAYDQLLKSHGDRVKVNFVFSVPIELKDNQATQLASRMIEILMTEGREKAMNCMRAWYTDRNVDRWLKQFGTNVEKRTEVEKILKAHAQWCELNEINYTPATVVEGQLYPQEYKVLDLPMLIADMILEKQAQSEETLVAS